jgi:protein-tyrosine phosphatase
MAEAVMRKLVDDAGLAGAIEVASAGTGRWHVGNRADKRAIAAAAARGYVLDGVARQVRGADFVDFDLLVGLDGSHVRELRERAPDLEGRLKVRLLLDGADVPDPYYGSRAQFDRALELIENGCRALLDELVAAAEN